MDQNNEQNNPSTTESGNEVDKLESVTRSDMNTSATLGAGIETENALGPGTAIGRYVILELTGVGGMGCVYKAYDPDLARNVALKILHASNEGSKATEYRNMLLREAQISAKLSHPNVVTIHDVGLYQDQVFIAMELIEGQSLRDWLSDKSHTLTEKCSILTQAGRGLAAAHRADLVHLDFKPENIIVGSDGRVRVSDFGLARIQKSSIESNEWNLSSDSQSSCDSGGSHGSSNEDDNDRNLNREVQRSPIWEQIDQSKSDESGSSSGSVEQNLTNAKRKRVMGTPPYMSPEQINCLELDHRSDQFSYCVVMHEVLYGKRPFQAKTIRKLKHKITQGKIIPLVTDANVPSWIRRIILKGLAIDREQRYRDLNTLLDDLNNDPTIKRNRLLAFSSVVVFFLLSLFGTWKYFGHQPTLCQGAQLHWQGIWDSKAREAISTKFSASGLSFAQSVWHGVESTINTYTNTWNTMYTQSCKATRVLGELSETVLDARMFCLSQRLSEVEGLVAILQRADPTKIKNAYQAATNLDRISTCAEVEAFTSSMNLPKDEGTRRRIKLIRSRISQAKILGEMGNTTKGMTLAKRAIEYASQVAYRPLMAEALFAVSKLHEKNRSYQKAEQSLKLALVEAKKCNHRKLEASIYNRLIFVTGYLRRKPAIAEYLADIARASFATQQNRDDYLAEWNNNVGIVFLSNGYNEKAVEHLQKALDIWSQLFGFEHPKVAACANNLAIAYRNKGEYQKAIDLHTKSLESMKNNLGSQYPNIAEPLTGLGIVYRLKGDFDKSLDYQLQALSIREKVLGKEHLDVAYLLSNLSVLYNNMGDHDKALSIQQRVLYIRKKGLAQNHPDMAESHASLGIILTAKKDYSQALQHFQKSREILEQIYGVDQPHTVQAQKNIAYVYNLMGKPQKASESYRRALITLERHYGSESLQVAQFLIDQGQAYYKTGESKKSLACFERALAIFEKHKGKDHIVVADALNNIAESYENKHHYAKALTYRRRAYDILSKNNSDDIQTTLQYLILDFYQSKQAANSVKFFRDILKQSHPEKVAEVFDNLGYKIAKTGKLKTAITLVKKSLAIKRKNLGRDHEQSIATQETLCRLFRQTKDFHDARSCYQQLIKLVLSKQQNKGKLGEFYYQHAQLSHILGDYDSGISSYKQVLEIWTRELGSGDNKVANALFNLGSLLFDKQDFSPAANNFERALEIWNRDHKSHADQASKTYRYLGDIAIKQNRFSNAVAHYEKSLSLLSRDQHTYYNDVFDLLIKLGESAHNQALPDQARQYYHRSLAIADKVLDDPSNRKALVFQRLGDINRTENKIDKAVLDYQNALKHLKNSKAGHGLNRAIVLINLGDIASAKQDWKSSRSYYQSALGDMAKLSAPHASHKRMCLYKLGIAEQKLGNPSKAYKYLKQALEVIIDTKGQDSKNLAAMCFNLGVVAQQLKKPKQALAYYQRSLDSLEQTQDGKQGERFRVLERIAALHESLGETKKAIGAYQRALNPLLNTNSQLEGESVRLFAELLKLYRIKGLAKQGVALYSRHLTQLQKAIKTSDKNIPKLFEELGHALGIQKEHMRALATYKYALSLYEKEYGQTSPKLGPILHSMATVYREKGDYSNMVDCLVRVLEIRKRHLHAYHPDLAEIYKEVGHAFYLEKSYTKAITAFEKAISIYRYSTPTAIPELEFAKAQLMWSIGREKPKAIKLAKKAHKQLQAFKTLPKVRIQIEKWLSSKASD